MPATNMTGYRKWRFTVGVSVLSLDATDFWVEHTANKVDQGVELGMKLNAIWEKRDGTVSQGILRRVYMEERLKTIQQSYVGQKGTLETDYGTASAKTYSNITLLRCSPTLQDFNDMLEYALEFSYPLSSVGGGGQEIARTLAFNGKTITADNFILEYGRDTRATFKPLWRAAPVRVYNGPGLKRLLVRAIKDGVSGANALAKRQAAEAEIETWANSHVDQEATLTIDSVSKGTWHLESVKPSDLTLTDALVYELSFIGGYSS